MRHVYGRPGNHIKGREGFISLFFLFVAFVSLAVLTYEAVQLYAVGRVKKEKRARAQLHRVGKALLDYASLPASLGSGVTNRFPDSLSDLASQNLLAPSDLRDPWGQALVYLTYNNPSAEGGCIAVYPPSPDLSAYPVAVVISKGADRTLETSVDASAPASVQPGGDDLLVVVTLKELADKEWAETEMRIKNMASVAVNEWMRGYYHYCVWKEAGDDGYNEYCGTGNEQKLWPQDIDALKTAGGLQDSDIVDAGGSDISYQVTGDEEVTFTATCPSGYVLKRSIPSGVKPQ